MNVWNLKKTTNFVLFLVMFYYINVGETTLQKMSGKKYLY